MWCPWGLTSVPKLEQAAQNTSWTPDPPSSLTLQKTALTNWYMHDASETYWQFSYARHLGPAGQGQLHGAAGVQSPMQQPNLAAVQQEGNSTTMPPQCHWVLPAVLLGVARQQWAGDVAPILAMLTTEGVLSRKSCTVWRSSSDSSASSTLGACAMPAQTIEQAPYSASSLCMTHSRSNSHVCSCRHILGQKENLQSRSSPIC